MSQNSPVWMAAPRPQRSAPRCGRAGVAALALSLLLGACGTSADPGNEVEELNTARFGIPAKSAFYVPEILGVEKGIFAEEGIDFKIQVAAPPALVAGAMSGDIPYDGATATAIQARLVSQTPLTVVFCTFGLPMFELFAQKDITDLADLSGKSVAVTSPNSADQYVMQAQLEGLGVDYSSYSFVATGGSDLRYKALTSGSVAAAMLPPPFNQMAEEEGYTKLTSNEATNETCASGFAVSEAYLADHPDEVKKMIRAELRNMQYIRDNKDEAIEVMTSELGMDPAIGEAAYEETVRSMTDKGRISQENLEGQVEQIRETVGGKAATASTEGVVDYSLLNEVLQESN